MASYDDWDDFEAPPRFYFSGVEVFHLLASVVVLTLAFAVLGATCGDADARCTPTFLGIDLDLLLRLLPWAAIAVVPAFILHELAHKLVAQRMDMWAEFRANFLGLFGGLAATVLLKFLFAIPGAVQIVGHADKRDAGIISIVGPMVNLFLGYGAFILDSAYPQLEVPGFSGGGIGGFFQLLGLLNAALAAFNMLPVGPLDGRKILRWSWLAFAGMWMLVLALVALILLPILG